MLIKNALGLTSFSRSRFTSPAVCRGQGTMQANHVGACEELIHVRTSLLATSSGDVGGNRS